MSFQKSSTRKPVIYGIDPREYHKQDIKRGDAAFVMSKSQLWKFRDCPSEWLVGEEVKSTEAMKWGSLVDCLLLFPSIFETVFAVAPDDWKDWRGSRGEWRTTQEELGKIAVKSSDVTEAKSSIETLMKDERAKAFLDSCKKQVQVNVDWLEDGITIPIKCLIDLVPDKKSEFKHGLGDFKTSASLGHDAWERMLGDKGYHYQAAIYIDAWNAATGETRNTFYHIIQKSESPWSIGRRMVGEESLEAGRTQYRYDLHRYAQCIKSGIWPSYDDEEQPSRMTIDGFTVAQIKPWHLI